MRYNYTIWPIFTIILMLIIGCNKEESELFTKENSQIDKLIKFSVLWEKEIENSTYDAIFFDKYFILPQSLDEVDIYSKNTGEHIVKIDANLIPNIFRGKLIINGDELYSFSNENSIFYKYNLLTNEINHSDSIEFILEFVVDNSQLYYASFDAVIKTDFNLSYRDTLFKFKDISTSYSTNFIQMKLYNSEDKTDKYLALSYREQNGTKDSQFKLHVFDLNTGYPELLKSFSMNDNIYTLKIEKDNLCLSSYQMVYIYNFTNKDYYLINSNHTNNIKRSVHLLSNNNSHGKNRVYYYNGLKFNSYSFHTGNTEWTLNNRNIEDVSNIKLLDNYYLVLLKENSLNIIDSYSGLIKAKLNFKIDGEPKYFRECSSVFNENEVILRQGNNRILKVAINKF